MNSDFAALLSRLAKHRVRYLVVGGYAVIHYCEPRYTKDIDIFVEASVDTHVASARRSRSSPVHCPRSATRICKTPSA